MGVENESRDVTLPRVQMAFACEGVSQDMFQRVSFGNVIDQLGAVTFPATTPQFFVVFGLEADFVRTYTSVRMVISFAETGKVIKEQPLADIPFTTDKWRARVIGAIMGLSWENPGRYIVRLMSASLTLASFTILIQQQPMMQQA